MLERDNLSFLDEAQAEAHADTSSSSSSSTSSNQHHQHLPDMAAVKEARRGVPQFRLPHVMLGRGLNELEELFPGFK